MALVAGVFGPVFPVFLAWVSGVKPRVSQVISDAGAPRRLDYGFKNQGFSRQLGTRIP